MARPKKVVDPTATPGTPEVKTKRKYTKRAASWEKKGAVVEAKVEGKKLRGRRPRKNLPGISETGLAIPALTFVPKHREIIHLIADLSMVRTNYGAANKGISDKIDGVVASFLDILGEDLGDYEDLLKARDAAKEAAEALQKASIVSPIPPFPVQAQKQPPLPFDPLSAASIEKKNNGSTVSVQ